MIQTSEIEELKQQLAEANEEVEKLRRINKNQRKYAEYLQGVLTQSNVSRSQIFKQ